MGIEPTRQLVTGSDRCPVAVARFAFLMIFCGSIRGPSMNDMNDFWEYIKSLLRKKDETPRATPYWRIEKKGPFAIERIVKIYLPACVFILLILWVNRANTGRWLGDILGENWYSKVIPLVIVAAVFIGEELSRGYFYYKKHKSESEGKNMAGCPAERTNGYPALRVDSGWSVGECTVFNEEREIARIGGWWHRACNFDLDGNRYDIRGKDGMIGLKPFLLEKDGIELARAEKESLVSSSYTVKCNDGEYYLTSAPFCHLFTDTYIIQQNDETIGMIPGEGSDFSLGCLVDLPVRIALPVRIFITWVVLYELRRNRD